MCFPVVDSLFIFMLPLISFIAFRLIVSFA